MNFFASNFINGNLTTIIRSSNNDGITWQTTISTSSPQGNLNTQTDSNAANSNNSQTNSQQNFTHPHNNTHAFPDLFEDFPLFNNNMAFINQLQSQLFSGGHNNVNNTSSFPSSSGGNAANNSQQEGNTSTSTDSSTGTGSGDATNNSQQHGNQGFIPFFLIFNNQFMNFAPPKKDFTQLLEKLKLSTLESDLEDPCVICLESFNKGQDVYNMPCKHFYHKDCLYKWFKEKKSCPTCRMEVN